MPASTLHFIKVRCLVKYLMILFTGLFVQALYTLGSTVWPVKCAPKTTGFLLGMLTICGNLFYYGVKLFYPHTAITPRESGLEDMTVILLVSLTLLAFIIFIWWVAFTRFKEWEVVKRW